MIAVSTHRKYLFDHSLGSAEIHLVETHKTKGIWNSENHNSFQNNLFHIIYSTLLMNVSKLFSN